MRDAIESTAPCVCGAARDSKKWEYMNACSKDCFHKDFWQEKINWSVSGDVTPEGSMCVRARHTHYVGDLKAGIVPHRSFLGYAGAVWYIQFTSGPHAPGLYKTNNLWCQGDIPLELHATTLADNAKILTKEEYYALTGESYDPSQPYAP